MKSSRRRKAAHKLRQQQQDSYQGFQIKETVVNGITVRSKLEAEWIELLYDCEAFKCYECIKVPLWIDGSYGRILGNYKPDVVIEDEEGNRTLVEFKPTAEMVMLDDRQKRALELNPRYKFVVIGGYPHSSKGVTVRMMTGKKELVHEGVTSCQVLELLGCECQQKLVL